MPNPVPVAQFLVLQVIDSAKISVYFIKNCMMRKLFTFAFAVSMAVSSMSAAKFDNGIFILNEDWFGHNASSVNFYSYDDNSILYHAYQAANPGLTLGNTSQFAELGTENIYFCSKQNYGTTGGRLIVADAKTLASKASIEAFGADTRAFVSIDDSKAYISTSGGIYTFDKTTNTVGEAIEGTTGKEVGNMALVRGKVLGTARGTGIYVINTLTNELEKTVAIGDITTVFVVNGQPYAAVNNAGFGAPKETDTEQFVKLNPETFEPDETLTVPMASQNTWFAWKNCVPAIDEQNEVLYYSPYENCKFISKYDLKTGEFVKEFINFDGKQTMYGSVVGYDPENHYVVAATFETYASKNYWLNIYDTNGNPVKTMPLSKNYWFPAMLLFAHSKAPSAVDDVNATKTVASVQYVNLQGQVSAEPFAGMNIKVVTYTDGTQSASKMMK